MVANFGTYLVMVCTCRNVHYTVGHKKEPTYIFLFCNFVRNQRILMQFSLLDFKMNDTCDSMNVIHLTYSKNACEYNFGFSR